MISLVGLTSVLALIYAARTSKLVVPTLIGFVAIAVGLEIVLKRLSMRQIKT